MSKSKRAERATELLLEAAREIARGVTTVRFKLPWGSEVEWRASSTTICGTSTRGVPFTITEVTAEALIAWLRGMSLTEAFPKMDPADRQLLRSGYV